MGSTPISERLERLAIPEPNSGCWIWCGHIKSNGYGTLGVKIGTKWKTIHAHRASYEAYIGFIPPFADLDHLCRNRSCINPDHLEPVSRSENLKRSPLMNRQTHKTACPQGHQYSGTDNRGRRICRECMRLAEIRYRERKRK